MNENVPAAFSHTETPSDLAPTAPVEAPPEPQVEEVPQENGHGKADVFEALDPTEVVQEAEQMLRQAAPHDYDLLVIGAGPGGYVAALRAAQLGQKVAVVEEREVGGVCLNRGCIPTKTLLESVGVMRIIRRAAEYGIEIGGEKPRPNPQAMHARKREVVKALRENVQHLLFESGVDFLAGRARFVGNRSIEIAPLESDSETASTRSNATRESLQETPSEKRVVTAANIVIASGSLPAKLPVEGADLEGIVTTDEILQGDESVPESLVVVGGGAVGVEFAYLYHEMGARVTLLETAPTVLPSEDEAIGTEMQRILAELGIDLQMNSRLSRIVRNGANLDVFFTREDGGEEETKITTSRVLMASGRRADTDNLDLETAGIEHEKGRIKVDEMCRTNVEGVYAIGDCVRGAGWAHLASGEGTLVAEHVSGLLPSVDLTHVPSCYYTHPEIASVGMTLKDAQEKGIAARLGTFYFRANGKAAAAGDHDGFVQIVVEDESDKLLGCQIIGPRATDIISEAVLALKTSQTISEMVGAIHAHPTFSEALPEAAMAARKEN